MEEKDKVERANHELARRQAEILAANERLTAANAEIEIQRQELEARKQKLEATNRELAASLQTISRQQERIVQTEKLEALLEITPILTHELNTPLGAIKGSLQNMGSLLPDLITILPDLSRKLPAEELPQFQAALKIVFQQGATELSSREERQLVHQTAAALAAKKIPNAELIAEKLVGARLHEHFAQFELLLHDSEFAAQSTSLLYTAGRVLRQITSINGAANRLERVRKTIQVFAYRAAEGESAESMDLVDNIRDVLALYDYYIQQGLALELDVQARPQVRAFPHELAQLWSNLFMNAVKAMRGQGKLHIRVFVLEDYACVEITDTGPGIPPERLPLLFTSEGAEASSGIRTGFGLSICWHIVEHYGGNITVASTPGNTTFTVRLPIEV
jgi:signal transduction histidine kinase